MKKSKQSHPLCAQFEKALQSIGDLLTELGCRFSFLRFLLLEGTRCEVVCPLL